MDRLLTSLASTLHIRFSTLGIATRRPSTRTLSRRAIAAVVIVFSIFPVVALTQPASATTSAVWRATPTSVFSSVTTTRSMSCVSSTFCVATKNANYVFPVTGTCSAGDASNSSTYTCNVYTYDGTNWTGAYLGNASIINGVSCVTTSFCMAVSGGPATYIYNGSTWALDMSAPAGGNLDVSCVTTTFCMGVGSNAMSVGDNSWYTWNGTSWSAATTLVGTTFLQSVSCVTTTFCTAADSQGKNVATWAYDPLTMTQAWTVSSVASAGFPSHTSCASTTFCVAVTTTGYEETFNGTSWSSAALINSGSNFVSVSCPSTSFCMALDSNGNSFTYDGSSWSGSSSSGLGSGTAVLSCSSTTSCVGANVTSTNVYSDVAPTVTAFAPATGTPSIAIPTTAIGATLAGGASPTGTVSFTVFNQTSAPTTCTSGGTAVGTAAVTGIGTVQSSASYTPVTAGNYWWYASYGGDSANTPSASLCGAGMTETVVSTPSSSPTPVVTTPSAIIPLSTVTPATVPTVTTIPSAPAKKPVVTVPVDTSAAVAGNDLLVGVSCANSNCNGVVQLTVARHKKGGGYSHIVLASSSYSLQAGQQEALRLLTTTVGHEVFPRSAGKKHWRTTATITTTGGSTIHSPVYVQWKKN